MISETRLTHITWVDPHSFGLLRLASEWKETETHTQDAYREEQAWAGEQA